VSVVNARFLKPMDREMLDVLAQTHKLLVTSRRDGGERLPARRSRRWCRPPPRRPRGGLGVPDRTYEHAPRAQQLADVGLTGDASPRASAHSLRRVAHHAMNVGSSATPTIRILAHSWRRSNRKRRACLKLYSEERVLSFWPTPPPTLSDVRRQARCLITVAATARCCARAPPQRLEHADHGPQPRPRRIPHSAAPDNLDWALDAVVRQAYTTEARLALQSTITGKSAKPVRSSRWCSMTSSCTRAAWRASCDSSVGGWRRGRPSIRRRHHRQHAHRLDRVLDVRGGTIVVPTVDAIVVTAICPIPLRSAARLAGDRRRVDPADSPLER